MIYMILRGQLGNQLFQYALASRLAQEYDMEIVLLELFEKYDLYEYKLQSRVRLGTRYEHFVAKVLIKIYEKILRIYFRIKGITDIDEDRYLFEKKAIDFLSYFGLFFFQSGYIELPSIKRRNNLFYGFFQSEKYFSSRKEELVQDVVLYDTHKMKVIDGLINSLGADEITCLHIRMGDYQNNPIFGVCTWNYYQTAVDKMIELHPDTAFYVFSNEINKVKDKLEFRNRKVIYEKGNLSNKETLMIMSRCNHFIMSNSTFSWWAQYLSNVDSNKTVIVPDRWLNIKGPFDDIFMDDWIKVPV